MEPFQKVPETKGRILLSDSDERHGPTGTRAVRWANGTLWARLQHLFWWNPAHSVTSGGVQSRCRESWL